MSNIAAARVHSNQPVSRLRNTSVAEQTNVNNRLEHDYFLVPFQAWDADYDDKDKKKTTTTDELLARDYKNFVTPYEYKPQEQRNFRSLLRGELIWIHRHRSQNPMLHGTVQPVNSAQLNQYYFDMALTFLKRLEAESRADITNYAADFRNVAFPVGSPAMTGEQMLKQLHEEMAAKLKQYCCKLRKEFCLMGVMTDNVIDDGKRDKTHFANQKMNLAMMVENISLVNMWKDIKMNESIWVVERARFWTPAAGAIYQANRELRDLNKWNYMGEHDLEITGLMKALHLTAPKPSGYNVNKFFCFNEIVFWKGIGQVISATQSPSMPDLTEEDIYGSIGNEEAYPPKPKMIGVCTLTNQHTDGSAKRAYGSIQTNLQIHT
jgi:hypothetical protein